MQTSELVDAASINQVSERFRFFEDRHANITAEELCHTATFSKLVSLVYLFYVLDYY